MKVTFTVCKKTYGHFTIDVPNVDAVMSNRKVNMRARKLGYSEMERNPDIINWETDEDILNFIKNRHPNAKDEEIKEYFENIQNMNLSIVDCVRQEDEDENSVL